MLEKIIQVAVEFYGKVIGVYRPAYFLWLTKKLSIYNPFAMILISIILFFLVAIYIWFRNRND